MIIVIIIVDNIISMLHILFESPVGRCNVPTPSCGEKVDPGWGVTLLFDNNICYTTKMDARLRAARFLS